jgi:hypothetical protein
MLAVSLDIVARISGLHLARTGGAKTDALAAGAFVEQGANGVADGCKDREKYLKKTVSERVHRARAHTNT